MGEYTTFVCRECGYTADKIRWGVSANDPRKRFMPAVCVECKALTEVDLTGADILVDEFHCLTCGSQLSMPPANSWHQTSGNPSPYAS